MSIPAPQDSNWGSGQDGADLPRCAGCHVEYTPNRDVRLCLDCEIFESTLLVARTALDRPWARRARSGCSA